VVRESYEKYGMSPVAHLDQLGILDNKFLAAHANLVTDEEVNILAVRRDCGESCRENN